MLRPSFFGPANLMTLVRLPLALLIWRKPADRRFVLGVLAAAGISDLLDGQIARRIPGTAHPSGAWLDPLCDKVFVLSALGAVTFARRPPVQFPWYIGLREIVAAPLLALFITRARGDLQSAAHAYAAIDWKAAPIGKVATFFQFSAMGAMLFRHRWTKPLAMVAGISGPLANLHYYRRAMGNLKAARRTAMADKVIPLFPAKTTKTAAA